MKIGLIGYYYNIGPFLSLTNGFVKNNVKVDFFPLMYYMDHDRTNLLTHLEAFINGKSLNDKIISSDGKIDVLLWKYFNIPIDILSKIKENNNIINVMYNWHDPEITSDSAIEFNSLNKFVKYMDIVFTTSKISIPFYKKYGVKNIEFTSAAYDPSNHRINKNIKYKYDISFIINNLYEGNELGIDRKTLIDNIIKIPNIKFALFGIPQLKNHYPLHYIGELSNDKLSDVINESRININTHHTQQNGGSLNERAYQILASGGLMLMDHCSEYDEHIKCGEDYVRLDQVNIIDQITDILKNYDNYASYKVSGNNKIKKYTWEFVTNNIIKTINKIYNKKPNIDVEITNADIKLNGYNGREILDRYTIESELFILFRLIREFGPNSLVLNQLSESTNGLTDINFYLNNYFIENK